MVFIMVHRLEEYRRIMLRDLEQFSFEMCPQPRVDDVPPVLRRYDDVVFATVNAMIPLPVFHAFHFTMAARTEGAPCIPDLTVGGLCARD